MSETNDRSLERVATLLRQAEDFRRHGEDGSADAALALAEKIIFRRGFDEATVAATRDASTAQIVKVVVEFTGIYRQTLLRAAHRYVLALGVLDDAHAPSWTRKNVDELWIFGYESDVEHARTLIASLQVQCLAALDRWARVERERLTTLSPMSKFKERRTFIDEFSWAASERIRRTRRELVKEHSDSAPGTEVALRGRRDAVDEWVRDNFNLTSSRSHRTKSGTAAASVAGSTAGYNAVTGETQLGVTRRSITTG